MAEHLVFIVDNDFVPRQVLAVAGDTVTWENRTAVKNTATRTDDPEFDTGDIKPGERSQPIEFEHAGDLTYVTRGPGGFEGMIKISS